MSTVVSFTLEQECQKSGGPYPPVWKVEGPLPPASPPPHSAAYGSSVRHITDMAGILDATVGLLVYSVLANSQTAEIFSR